MLLGPHKTASNRSVNGRGSFQPSRTMAQQKCMGLAQLLMHNLHTIQGGPRRASVQPSLDNNARRTRVHTAAAAGSKPRDSHPALDEKNRLTMMLTMGKQQTKKILTQTAVSVVRKSLDGCCARQAVVSPKQSGGKDSKKSCGNIARKSLQRPVPSVLDTGAQGKVSDYTIGGQLGQGAYAVVKNAVHKSTGRKVAIKIYEKYKIADSQRKTCVNREIRVMKKLTHANIVQLYETIDTTKQLFLVMELVKGRSLYSYIRSRQSRKLEEPECMRIFRQVVAGIEYCHKNNVVHRDIKMENLLLDEQQHVKIIDFGFSIFAASTQRLKIFCGTPSYMAPEIVNKKEYCGPPADMWSLGILLFAMLCGTFPFRGSNEHELFRCISRCQFTYPAGVSNSAKGIIGRLLCLDPARRASTGEVRFCAGTTSRDRSPRRC